MEYVIIGFKRIIMKFFFLAMLLFSLNLYANGNSVQRGQTYYKFILKPMLGYDGAVFTKKYTKAQWNKLFENESKAFKEVFKGNSNELNGFLESKKFQDIAGDVKAFAIFYAKDASVTPSCQE